MQGLMMDQQLLISGLLQHADRHHADAEIVSKTADGSVHRYTYRDAHARARKLASALQRLGVQPGERIATLAWNSYRHFEVYYAVAGSGAVIHTINPRLFPDQITYIANHAEDLRHHVRAAGREAAPAAEEREGLHRDVRRL